MTPGISRSQPTGEPAGQTKKMKPTVYICVRTLLNDVDLMKCMYPSQQGMSTAQTLTYRYVNSEYVANMSVPVQVCTWYTHVYAGQNVCIHVLTCTYTYEQCKYMFILAYVCTMYVHVSYMYVQYQNCTYMYTNFRKYTYMYEGAT